MRKNFQDCLDRVLKDEGGFTNVRGDNGGATNYGITIFDVRKYVNANATEEDVRNLSLATAKSIYKTKYWDAISADTLPSGVDYACFDYAVNSGIGRIKKVRNLTIDQICDERKNFLISISNPDNPKYAHNYKFRKGWLARVERVRAYSHKLAGKKDVVSGPAGSVVAGVSLWATLNQYIHSHPYVIAGSIIAGAVAIGLVIHFIRNK